MKSHNLPGVVFILAASVLWGTTGTAQAFAPVHTNPVAIGIMRMIVASAALLLITLLRGDSFRHTRWPVGAVILAAVSMAAYNLFFFAGVANTGVAIGTMVTIGSAPIMAGLLAWLIRKESIRKHWLAATALAVFGGVLLIVPNQQTQINPLGVVLALSAGLAYASFTIFGKVVVEQAPPFTSMTLVITLGAVFLAPLLFFVDLQWLAQPRGWGVALHLGVITTAIAYTLYAHGLKTISASSAVTLSLAEPLTAGVLGIFLLGEQMTLSSASGMILVLAGLFIIATEKRDLTSQEFATQ